MKFGQKIVITKIGKQSQIHRDCFLQQSALKNTLFLRTEIVLPGYYTLYRIIKAKYLSFKRETRKNFPFIQSSSLLGRSNYQLLIINYQLLNLLPTQNIQTKNSLFLYKVFLFNKGNFKDSIQSIN